MHKLSDQEWFETIKKSYPNGNEFPYGLPAFPPEQLQKNTVGLAAEDALTQAFEFYVAVKEALFLKNIQLSIDNQIIDFGCGWGRISRFFIKDVSVNNIYGLDVEQSFIDVCTSTFANKNFSLINPFPPVQNFADSSCDLIVAYSVFSHLSEQAFLLWLKEFHRILRPKGVVAFTTRHKHFLDYCEKLKGLTNSGYQHSLAHMFDNFNDARRRYGAGEFVFSNAKGVTGGGAMNENFYGEAFIPEKYAKKAAENTGFSDVITILPHGLVDQQTYLLFK